MMSWRGPQSFHESQKRKNASQGVEVVMRVRNLLGQRFTRLVVTARGGNINSGQATWVCQCDCGKEVTVRSSDLLAGKQKSCGCWHRDRAVRMGRARRRHGYMAAAPGTPERRTYNKYQSAKARCQNPNSPQHKNYGGRGILFLFSSVEELVNEIGLAPPNMTLGRIDNDSHYMPGNVQWEPWGVQNNNRRNNVRITAFDRTQTQGQWAREFGLVAGTLKSRIQNGWPTELALTTPVGAAQARKRKHAHRIAPVSALSLHAFTQRLGRE
jgi:hypothetical protein